MSFGVSRAVVIAAGLTVLAGCGSSGTANLLPAGPDAASATDAAKSASAAQPAADTTASTTTPASAATAAQTKAAPPDVTGTVVGPVPRRVADEPVGSPGMQDPMDDLVLGKRQFHEGNYALAEKHFRRVVELDNVPAQRKAEAWVGLAASYDRLKRFDLADRAYAAALRILGPTPELLNNQGFSYLLRGDYARARAKLTEALDRDPTNPYIQNNLDILEKSMRGDGGRKKV